MFCRNASNKFPFFISYFYFLSGQSSSHHAQTATILRHHHAKPPVHSKPSSSACCRRIPQLSLVSAKSCMLQKLTLKHDFHLLPVTKTSQCLDMVHLPAVCNRQWSWNSSKARRTCALLKFS